MICFGLFNYFSFNLIFFGDVISHFIYLFCIYFIFVHFIFNLFTDLYLIVNVFLYFYFYFFGGYQIFYLFALYLFYLMLFLKKNVVDKILYHKRLRKIYPASSDLLNMSLFHNEGVNEADFSLCLGRQWVYQTCTEFGFYQSTDSLNQPFSGFPLPWVCSRVIFVSICRPEGCLFAVCKCIMGLEFFWFFCFHKNKRIELSFILISYPSAITCSSALIFIIWAPHWTMLFSRPMRNMEDMTSEPLVSSSLMVTLTPGMPSEWPRTSQAIFRLSSSKVCPIFIFIYSCFALNLTGSGLSQVRLTVLTCTRPELKTFLSWV